MMETIKRATQLSARLHPLYMGDTTVSQGPAASFAAPIMPLAESVDAAGADAGHIHEPQRLYKGSPKTSAQRHQRRSRQGLV